MTELKLWERPILLDANQLDALDKLINDNWYRLPWTTRLSKLERIFGTKEIILTSGPVVKVEMPDGVILIDGRPKQRDEIYAQFGYRLVKTYDSKYKGE